MNKLDQQEFKYPTEEERIIRHIEEYLHFTKKKFETIYKPLTCNYNITYNKYGWIDVRMELRGKVRYLGYAQKITDLFRITKRGDYIGVVEEYVKQLERCIEQAIINEGIKAIHEGHNNSI